MNKNFWTVVLIYVWLSTSKDSKGMLVMGDSPGLHSFSGLVLLIRFAALVNSSIAEGKLTLD